MIGVANPDTETSVTFLANTTQQFWGHRRFVSAPLAARTFANADGNWTFSYARSQSNANHNATFKCMLYAWRPSTGAVVGTTPTGVLLTGTTFTGTTETANSVTGAWVSGAPTTILDGDILVFDVVSVTTQLMATAYTEQFAYDGATEASTTTCASFLTPPAALTLFTPPNIFSGEGGELRGDSESIQALTRATVRRSSTF